MRILLKWKMAAEHRNEDYPEEIDDQLTSFDSSVSSVKTMLEKLMSIPKNVQPQKVGFTLKNKQQQHLSMLLSTRFYQLDFPLIRPQIMEPYHRQPYTCIILTESIRRLPEVWDEPHLLPLSRRFNQKWFKKNIPLGFIVIPLFTAEPFGSSQVGSDVSLHPQFLILE